MPGFQQQVLSTPAPGVAGDFCSTNPRFNVLAGPGALVAGTSLFVGRFAWVDAYDQVANCNGSGPVAGLVPRNWQGLITTYLAEATMQVYPGSQCFLMNGCDMWVINSGSTEALMGQKAYALYSSGLISFGATGSPPSAASGSTSSIAPNSGTFTGAIAMSFSSGGDEISTVLTAGAVTGDLIVPGMILTGTGVATGTKVVRQLTGTTGQGGTYIVDIPQTVASTAMTGTYGTLTVGGTVTGAFGVGDILTGTGVTAGTTITALGTGTGGAGTYIVSPSQTASSTAISASAGIETKWFCRSPGAPGELVKISSTPLG